MPPLSVEWVDSFNGLQILLSSSRVGSRHPPTPPKFRFWQYLFAPPQFTCEPLSCRVHLSPVDGSTQVVRARSSWPALGWEVLPLDEDFSAGLCPVVSEALKRVNEAVTTALTTR